MSSPTEQNNKSKTDDTTDYIPAASYYALKVAFQSLKERFDKQTNRITVLEEENVKVKENQINEACKAEKCTTITVLEKKIDELSRQKSQLSHHAFKLATDNKNLWDSLSLLKEEKKILLDQIKYLSSKLDEENNKLPPTNSSHSMQIDDSFDSVNENIETADGEVEKDSLVSLETVKNLSLDCGDNRVTISELNYGLKETIEKLTEDKTLLKTQQAVLKDALVSLRKLNEAFTMYSAYLKNIETDKSSSAEKDIETKKNLEELLHSTLPETTPEVGTSCSNSQQLKCPFCGKVFDKYDEKKYHEHYTKHVQNTSDDESVLKSFEVINHSLIYNQSDCSKK